MAWRDRHSIGDICRECHKKDEAFEGCHDVCVKFLTAKAERDAWLELIRKNKEKERIIENRGKRKRGKNGKV